MPRRRRSLCLFYYSLIFFQTVDLIDIRSSSWLGERIAAGRSTNLFVEPVAW